MWSVCAYSFGSGGRLRVWLYVKAHVPPLLPDVAPHGEAHCPLHGAGESGSGESENAAPGIIYRGEKRVREDVERAVEEIRLAKQRALREIAQRKQEEPIVWWQDDLEIPPDTDEE